MCSVYRACSQYRNIVAGVLFFPLSVRDVRTAGMAYGTRLAAFVPCSGALFQIFFSSYALDAYLCYHLLALERIRPSETANKTKTTVQAVDAALAGLVSTHLAVEGS